MANLATQLDGIIKNVFSKSHIDAEVIDVILDMDKSKLTYKYKITRSYQEFEKDIKIDVGLELLNKDWQGVKGVYNFTNITVYSISKYPFNSREVTIILNYEIS